MSLQATRRLLFATENKIDYRGGLKAAACVCYAADKASYRTIMSQQPVGLR